MVTTEREQFARLATLLASAEGDQLDWAQDDARARAMAADRCYHAALLVGDTGPETACLIRALDLSGIPAVVLLDVHTVATEREARAAGASDCLEMVDLTSPLLQRALRYARERQCARRRVRELEERFASAFDHAPVGAAWLDSQGHWLRLNLQLQQMLRFSSDQLRGSDIEDLRHPDEVPFAEAGMFQDRPVGDRWVAERRLKTAGETFLWTHISVAPRVGAEGFIAIIEDLTAQKQAQDEVALMFELAPDMLGIAKDDHLIRVNRAFTDVLGHPPEVLLSTPIIEFVHPDDRTRTMAQIRRMNVGAASPAFTNRWVTQAGDYKWLEWHAKEDLSTGLRHVVARDFTERQQLRQQVHQMQKIEAIGQLAGGVAHDFNNILTSILGFAELAMDVVPECAPGRTELEEIMKAGGRAAALTQQLLAFSRQQLMRPEPLDPHRVVQDMSGMLRRLIGERIQLNLVESSRAPWIIEADKVQLEQVVLNLVVNARDAMPHGGCITAELSNVSVDGAYCAMHPAITPGDFVLLSINDTGAGMTPEVKARLFEPFYTTKESGKGTGLGLSTVYGIVKQSGGFIWVYSELGVGTTFKVYLPRAGGALPEAPAAPAPASRLTGTETILVVDDQADVRHVIAQVLRRNGYRVLTASCRDEAMSIIAAHDAAPDLLLVDLVLPAVAGPEIAAQAVEKRPGLRVLYMSGYSSDAATRTGAIEGRIQLLEKPFSAAALLRHVRKALA